MANPMSFAAFLKANPGKSYATNYQAYYKQYLPAFKAKAQAASDAAAGSAGSGAGGGGFSAGEAISGAGTGLQGWSMYQGMSQQKAANAANKAALAQQKANEVAQAQSRILELKNAYDKGIISQTTYKNQANQIQSWINKQPSFVGSTNGIAIPNADMLNGKIEAQWHNAETLRSNSRLAGADVNYSQDAIGDLSKRYSLDNPLTSEIEGLANPFEIPQQPQSLLSRTRTRVAGWFQNPAVRTAAGVAGVALASYLAYTGAQALMHGGIGSRLSGAVSLIGSFFSMQGGLTSLARVFSNNPAFAVNPWITVGVIAAIAIIAGLRRWFGRSRPSPTDAERNMNEMATKLIWTPGPVAILATGLMLAGAGINLNPEAPEFMELTVSAEAVRLATENLTAIDEAGNESAADPLNTVFVKKGRDEDRIVYFEPGKDGKEMVARVYTLRDGVRWGKPEDMSIQQYTSFFGENGKPNPDAIRQINDQKAITQAARHLEASRKASAVATAATMSHQQSGN